MTTHSHRLLLGLDGSAWVKLLFGFMVAALVASAAWVLDIRDRVLTMESVHTNHASLPMHPGADNRLSAMEDRLIRIERQQDINSTKLDALRDMQAKVWEKVK